MLLHAAEDFSGQHFVAVQGSTHAEIYTIGLDKTKLFCVKNVNIFLFIIFSICFVCSKEPSH